jgi:hypothetical protein
MHAQRIPTTLAALLLIPMATQHTNAQPQSSNSPVDAATAIVNVSYHHMQGVVRVNGIPVKRFGKEPSNNSAQLLTFPLAGYAINGANEVSLETKPTGSWEDASAQLALISGTSLEALEHPMFQQDVTAAATIRHSITLQNTPYHVFDDATPWKGENGPVLVAVKALHTAVAKRDLKAFAAFVRPEYDLLPRLHAWGTFDEQMKEVEGNLKNCTLAPLPAKLSVESYYGGRLVLVTDPDGAPPIRAMCSSEPGTPADIPWEQGAFWCYRQGIWIPLAMY